MMSLERSRGAVETLIPKPGQNLETATNKSENQDLSFETEIWKFVDYANIFLSFFQKMSLSLQSWKFFEFLASIDPFL